MLKHNPRILVVGSLVMDLVVSTEKFPGPGETVLGKSFFTAPGGKGANQAIQAARLGADVTMVGAVCSDEYGNRLIESLKSSGVNAQRVRRTDKASSAIGNILLTEKDGVTLHNRIIVVSGANATLSHEDVAWLEKEIHAFDMVMLQFEIPMEVNIQVAAFAAAAKVPVMVNPAPYAPAGRELLKNVTYIAPNEHEAIQLSGVDIHTGQGIDRQALAEASSAIRSMGAKCALITLGNEGSFIDRDGQQLYCPCVDDIALVDQTAAGDSYIGAFCVAKSMGLSDMQAMQLASYAATITVSKKGAQPSLPWLPEVVELMRQRKFTGFDVEALQCCI